MSRQRPVSLRTLLSTLPCFVLCLGVLTGCESGPTFRVVEFEGQEEWMNLSPFYGLVFSAAEEGASTPLAVREGDFLLSDPGEFFIPILASDEGPLDLDSRDNVVALAGTEILLGVDTVEGANWLRNATPIEMAALRMIGVGSDLNPETLSLLEQLAVHNPHVGLMIERGELLSPLLELFDPGTLMLGEAEVGTDTEILLAQEENVESLLISAEGFSNLDFLAQMRDLERLLLSDWDPGEIGPLPDGLANLRSVMVWEGELDDLAPLGAQPKLKELTLSFCEEGPNSETLDLNALASYPDLEVLGFRFCPTVADLSPLAALPNLKWLVLPESTTQEQFEEVVTTHPGLTLLDLVEPEGITDLTPVTELRKLQALLVGEFAPPDPLYGMDGLEYLAVFVEGKDSSFIGEEGLARLRAELPGTAISRITPFCLGSGFILLLLPLVGGAWWATRRRERRKSA